MSHARLHTLLAAAGLALAACKSAPPPPEAKKPLTLPPEMIGAWSRDHGGVSHLVVTVAPTGLTSTGIICTGSVAFTTLDCTGTVCTWTAAKGGQGSISLGPDGLTLQSKTGDPGCYDEGLSGLFAKAKPAVKPAAAPVEEKKALTLPPAETAPESWKDLDLGGRWRVKRREGDLYEDEDRAKIAFSAERNAGTLEQVDGNYGQGCWTEHGPLKKPIPFVLTDFTSKDCKVWMVLPEQRFPDGSLAHPAWVRSSLLKRIDENHFKLGECVMERFE